MNSRRLIILLYAVLFTTFGIGAGALFLDARAEYRALKQVQAAQQVAKAAAEARLAEQQRVLERLRNDPQFVEKKIRERLKYAKPGEFVFRFEDQ